MIARHTVVPAQAGTQERVACQHLLDSRLRGNDGSDSRLRGNDGRDSRLRGNDGSDGGLRGSDEFLRSGGLST